MRTLDEVTFTSQGGNFELTGGDQSGAQHWNGRRSADRRSGVREAARASRSRPTTTPSISDFAESFVGQFDSFSLRSTAGFEVVGGGSVATDHGQNVIATLNGQQVEGNELA
ncbi:MAG: hypothetical protein R3B96_03790 [Pirellulaceae bacterium]